MKWELIYYHERIQSPVSYWVHKGVDEDIQVYLNCVDFEPPFPKKDPVKGYPFLIVSVLSFEFKFASMFELAHVTNILSQKKLPTTIYLSNLRGTAYGPNNHWLSKLPGEIKSWTKRQKIVTALNQAKVEIEKAGLIF